MRCETTSLGLSAARRRASASRSVCSSSMDVLRKCRCEAAACAREAHLDRRRRGVHQDRDVVEWKLGGDAKKEDFAIRARQSTQRGDYDSELGAIVVDAIDRGLVAGDAAQR